MGSNNLTCRRCGAFLSAEGAGCSECGAQRERDAWLGRSLGGFTITRRISEPLQSAVYLATRGDLRAVVKLVLQRRDHELIERSKREAQAIQRLAHPCVVKLLSHGETEERYPYLITEFIEGETLRERLQRGTLSVAELRALMRPLCEAIYEAHQKGIYHRDLTPRNIMLQIDGAPRLLDFGFAALRGAETLTERGVVSGTPAYMSPEQWRGLANANAASDLYSLGVIAYQCLTAQLPIDAKTPLEWLQRHSAEAPLALGDLEGSPHQMRQAITRALQRDPAQRQASVLEFSRALCQSVSTNS